MNDKPNENENENPTTSADAIQGASPRASRATSPGANPTQINPDRIIGNMDTPGKAHLLAGSGFWHTQGDETFDIAPLTVTDGPHGLRKQSGATDHLGLNDSLPATCFPTGSAVACSFDPAIAYKMGRALGEECRKEDVAVLLGPGANIKRHPLSGRNFEYYSEDPLVSGTMAAAYIRGLQSCGVGASLKHLAANNQEKMRMVSDSVVDDRALNEIYLRPFEIAVKESHPWTVMGAYNRLNGTYCCENEWLLNDKLRGEWGFDGAVVTDWGGMSHSVESVRAGLDLVMPGPREDHAWAVAHAVQSGELEEEALDKATRNAIGLFDKYIEGKSVPYTCDMTSHLELARQIECESAVLLENDGVLPLAPTARVAVIGTMAKRPRFQGGGSSKINPIALDNAWDAICELGVNATYAAGYAPETGATNMHLLDEARDVAQNADVAIVFAGLPDRYESEGYDRIDMRMPEGHNRLIECVAESCAHTVVVLSGGAPMEMPWRSKVSAILLAHLGGCQVGHATADLLFGAVSPSGKLAETWPTLVEDVSLGESCPSASREIPYIESIFVGYRYYDSARIKVAYPFGYGKSYTTFSYHDLEISQTADGYDVTFAISNTGSSDGAEIAQVYAHAEDPAVPQPDQALVGFTRMEVPAGETRRATVHLDSRAFAYWQVDNPEGDTSTRRGHWRVDEGTWEIRVSSSSRDVRLAGSVALEAGRAPFEVSLRPHVPEERWIELTPYYHVHRHGFTLESFAKLYGRPLPKPVPLRPFSGDSALDDLRATFFGRMVIRFANFASDRTIDKSDKNLRNMMRATMHDMPLRAATMSGFVSADFYNGIIDLLNGRRLRGIARLLRR